MPCRLAPEGAREPSNMPTHHRGPRREVRALDAYIKLMRAMESLNAQLVRSLASAHLTLSQLGTLEALLHLGPMCQRALAAKLLKSSGNITTVVDNLEARRLVTRVRSAADRRLITLELTPAGRELIGGVFPAHAARIARAMGALSQDEQHELGRLCKKLGLALAADPLGRNAPAPVEHRRARHSRRRAL